MKVILKFTLVLVVQVLFSCSKDNSDCLMNNEKSSNTGDVLPVGVNLWNGRIIAENDSCMDILLESLKNKTEAELDLFETRLGAYRSLRASLGFNFYYDSITPVYSPELATVVNHEGLYQIGDSLFYVYKNDSLTQTHVLSPVIEDRIPILLSGVLSEDIFDVTEGEMEPKSGVSCGGCIYPIIGLVQFKQNDFSWKVIDKQGKVRDAYFYGRMHFDQIGRLKSACLRVTNKIKNGNLIFTIEEGVIQPQIGITEWNHYKKYCTMTYSSSITSLLNVYITTHSFYVGTRCARGAHYQGYFTGFYKDLNGQIKSKALPFYYKNGL